MEDKELDNMLKAHFSKQIEIPEKSADCPPIETLGRYVLGALGADELYNIGNHVKSCKFCSELIEDALLYSAYEKHIDTSAVSGKVKNMAKSLNPRYKTKRRKMTNYLKNSIWLMLSLASLVSSFFIPRHFLQFLILAVIFGLKWVFDRESTRTLIMIYNSWKRHDRTGEKDMEEIFKSRL